MTAPGQDERDRPRGWRGRVRGAVAERLGLKATALAVALLLWFVIRVMQLGRGAP